MLSAQAYSFHQKSKLAVALSWVSGYTNVHALLVCGVFVSHVTGNFTFAARDLADGVASRDHVELVTGYLYIGLIVAFASGAVISATMIEVAKRVGFRSKYIVPITAETILLIVFGVANRFHLISSLVDSEVLERVMLGGLLAMAMGIQNATITMISGSVVRTTHLTGVLTDLGLESVQYALWYLDKSRKTRGMSWERQNRILQISRRHPTFLRLALLSCIIVSFVLGVIVSVLIYRHFPNYVLVMPVSFLCFLVFMDWFNPIADVRQIDVLSDPELQLSGLIHELLPPQIGIFRTAMVKHGPVSRPPNFQAWIERIPQHHAVLILALSPMVQFDDNAMLNLDQALITLVKRRKTLILCGATPKAYAMLAHHGIVERMGADNVCDDVQVAIIRALAIVEDLGLPPTSDATSNANKPV